MLLKCSVFSGMTQKFNFIDNYIQFLTRLSWPALVAVMQKLVEVGMTGDAKEKERARDAEALQSQIFNTKFVVNLSFLTDVYNTFGFGVNCLQVRSAVSLQVLVFIHHSGRELSSLRQARLIQARCLGPI